jgi:hypothetical protein
MSSVLGTEGRRGRRGRVVDTAWYCSRAGRATRRRASGFRGGAGLRSAQWRGLAVAGGGNAGRTAARAMYLGHCAWAQGQSRPGRRWNLGETEALKWLLATITERMLDHILRSLLYSL